MKIKAHVLVLIVCVVGCLSACTWLKSPVSPSTPVAVENPAGGFDIATPAGTLHVDSKPTSNAPITGTLKDGTKYTWTPPAQEPPKTNWDALVGIGSKVLGIVTGHPELAFAALAGGKLIGEVAGITAAPVTAKKPEDSELAPSA